MKCNYCGNNSGIKDYLGGCVSCGAFEVKQQVQNYATLGALIHAGFPIDKAMEMNEHIRFGIPLDWRIATS